MNLQIDILIATRKIGDDEYGQKILSCIGPSTTISDTLAP